MLNFLILALKITKIYKFGLKSYNLGGNRYFFIGYKLRMWTFCLVSEEKWSLRLCCHLLPKLDIFTHVDVLNRCKQIKWDSDSLKTKLDERRFGTILNFPSQEQWGNENNFFEPEPSSSFEGQAQMSLGLSKELSNVSSSFEKWKSKFKWRLVKLKLLIIKVLFF